MMLISLKTETRSLIGKGFSRKKSDYSSSVANYPIMIGFCCE